MSIAPEYGSKINIKDRIKFEGVDDFSIIKEDLFSSPAGHIWYFDQWGNRCSPSKEDEIPLNFYNKDHYYIEIQDYDLNQNNFMPMIIYCYRIFKHGYENTKGILLNNLAYTDSRDCLDAARWICFAFKKELEIFYNSEVFSPSQTKDVILKDENENYYINPKIQTNLIPLEELEKNLIDDITEVPSDSNNQEFFFFS